MNPFQDIGRQGQAIWLDTPNPVLLDNGELQHWIDDFGLTGITAAPRTINTALLESSHYDPALRNCIEEGLDPEQSLHRLVGADAKHACRLLHHIYESSDRTQGYVSVPLSPHLAFDESETILRAKELWQAIGEPNLLIELPATREGFLAAEALLLAGINVNLTLLAGTVSYCLAHETYLRAMERRRDMGLSIDTPVSMVSVPLGSIDKLLDRQLDQRIHRSVSPAIQAHARELLDLGGIAIAKLIYAEFNRFLSDARWLGLAGSGAHPQQLVWTETGGHKGTTDETHYITALVGPYTVSTMSIDTAMAFARFSPATHTIEEDTDNAVAVMQTLEAGNIDLIALERQLLTDGIQQRIDNYDALLTTLERKLDNLHLQSESSQLMAMANNLRRDVIRMTTAAGSGHPTSCLSCAEIMSTLFFHEMRWDPRDSKARDVDQFILSKGHAAPILWASLKQAGAIVESLDTLRQFDSTLEGHPTPRNPWVKVATGSLGQGLSAANGMALAQRMDGIDARVFCLLGDGECSEGSVWEAAQFAGEQGLTNLVAIVDMNGLQQSGPAPSHGDPAILAQRFSAFGWKTLTIDGHDVVAIADALRQGRQGGPTAILARTVKGKGVSFLEGREGYHGKPLTEAQRDAALTEIPASKLEMRPPSRRVTTIPTPRPSYPPTPLPSYSPGEAVATRAAFGKALAALGASMPELVVLDGDVKNSTYTEYFMENYPERFIECNIAEQNMIGTALGLAVSGKIACAATFSAFLTRAHDFIRMAGYSQPEHLVLCGSHAGVSIGQDGPSQMGLEDLALFRAIEGATILYPSDAVSAVKLTERAVHTRGIVYLRTTRSASPVIYGNDEEFTVGGSKTLACSLHDALTIVACGITLHEARQAHRELLRHGIHTRVIDAYSVNPLDVATLEQAARETGHLLVVEDHRMAGGLGDAVSSQVGRHGKVYRMGVTTEPHSGSPDELMQAHHLSSDQITSMVLSIVGQGKSGTPD